MKISTLLQLFATPLLAKGYLVAPPGPVLPNTIQDCTLWFLITTAKDTCVALAPWYSVTVAQIIQYNPLVGSSCVPLIGFALCMQQNYGKPSTSSSISSTRPSTTLLTSSLPPPATTTTPSNGITTPTPFQDGMISNCNAFHLVAPGEQCASIASANGISLANFYTWNSAVNSGGECQNLWANTYACVGVLGSSPNPKPTATTSGSGVAAPTPVQPGITASCKKFHLVVAGDQCGAIASAAGVQLSSFYAWNPQVGNTCASLWLGYYVCVGV